MRDLLEMLKDINIVSTFLRLVLAVVFGGLIGSERGRHGRAAGLRTHILICVGAALTALTGLFVSGNFGGDSFRIAAQVVSGIGFLGAGTILVRNNSIVTGLTTAAGMWTTAAIGIAVGYGFYIAALFATVLCIFTAMVLTKLEASRKNMLHFYAEVNNVEKTGDIVDAIKNLQNLNCSVDIIPPKSNVSGNVGLVIDIRNPGNNSDVKSTLKEIDGLCFVVEENS